MYETTLLSATTTTLDYLDIDSDFASTITTTVSTALTAAPPLNVHHYYHYAQSYVESLSDEELAKLDTLVVNSDKENVKVKKLTCQ